MSRFNHLHLHTADLAAVFSLLFSLLGPILGTVSYIISITAGLYAIAYYRKQLNKP